MPSLAEVAKEAGVSIATASMVLNPGKHPCRVSAACAERVRAAAEKIGYVANYHAQSMKLGRAGMVAFALDVGTAGPGAAIRNELGTTYWGLLIGAVEVESRRRGVNMTIVGPSDKQRAPDIGVLGIRQRRFDGLVIPGVIYQHHGNPVLQEAPEMPIVVVEYAGKTALPVVDWDEARGVRMVIEHLTQLGHRELLWLGPVRPESGPPEKREALLLAAANAAGLRATSCHFNPAGDSDTPLSASPMPDAAETALRRHLAENSRGFTAVVCYNDLCAIGACGALQGSGLKIPEQVSVIGFDNVESRFGIPRITSVSHQLHEMGTRATEWLMEMIQNPENIQKFRGRRELIEPALVVRQSSGPAPA